MTEDEPAQVARDLAARIVSGERDILRIRIDHIRHLESIQGETLKWLAATSAGVVALAVSTWTAVAELLTPALAAITILQSSVALVACGAALVQLTELVRGGGDWAVRKAECLEHTDIAFFLSNPKWRPPDPRAADLLVRSYLNERETDGDLPSLNKGREVTYVAFQKRYRLAVVLFSGSIAAPVAGLVLHLLRIMVAEIGK